MSPRPSSILTRLASSLALLSLAASCAKAPATEAPTKRGGGEPLAFGAGGTFADAPAPNSLAVDSGRIDTLGTWAADNLEGERYQVPVEGDDLVLGPADARVTFVVFNDYQCPYCSRLDEALRELMKTYPTDVRVVVKHFPLAMHQRATPAALAVLAAHRQGRGMAMHQLVYDNQRALSDEDLRKLARQAQVPDPSRFAADLANPALDAQVQRDTALGTRLGVRSTPSFFVNGVSQRGAMSVEALTALYTEQVGVAERVIAAGAGRAEVYAALTARAPAAREEAPRPAAKPTAARPGRPEPSEHYAIPVDGRPSQGPADALVTVVEFSDFECPYCRRVQPTLVELRKRYGNKLRVVSFQQPLPMHKNAMNAALAALAAERQGKYWEMHDRLYAAAEHHTLSDGAYEGFAGDIGLDLKRFRKDLKDPKLRAKVDADQKIAAKFGASGTPAFFINGRPLSGAQPVEAFAAVIDEELVAAKAFEAKHKVSRAKLYATMAKGWKSEVAKPSVADSKRRPIKLAGLPARGKTKNAKIELVVCADFDCPFCKRGADLAEQILADKRYKNQVGFYFLHFPLPMHKNAESAHRAAIAAGEQGKFWEMHDLLFGDNSARSEAQLVDFAATLGLDTRRFVADMNSQGTTDKIAADKATCSALGVSGTPNFFINGRSMKGAVPLEAASEALDEELAR